MRTSSLRTSHRDRPGFYLPDFCAARSVLAVVLIAELVAVLLTLARYGISAQFWTDLAHTSLFLLWAALGTAAALCVARGLLSRLDVLRGSLLALLLMLGVTVIVTEGAWWLAASASRLLGVDTDALGADHAAFLLRNLAVGVIAGDATCSTASGEVVVGLAKGDMAAKSASGDVHIDEFCGRDLRGKTVSGDLRVGMARGQRVDVDLQTLTGNLRLPSNPSPVDARDKPAIRISFKSVSGDFELVETVRQRRELEPG